MAPEPDRQQAHEDDEVHVALEGRGVLEIEGAEGLSVLVVFHRRAPRSGASGRTPV